MMVIILIGVFYEFFISSDLSYRFFFYICNAKCDKKAIVIELLYDILTKTSYQKHIIRQL